MQVQTAGLGTYQDYIYTVIFARYNNQWLFCRAKTRSVFETAGGRIEPGETPLEAAKREFYEETGAVKYDIWPVFDFVTLRDGETLPAQVFFAHVYELGDMPGFEMAEVGLFDGLPEALRLPEITPVLFAHLQTLVAPDPETGDLTILAKACEPSKHKDSGLPEPLPAAAEFLDIYDTNRRPTGRSLRRGDPLTQGEYILVVMSCIMNPKGQFIITKRAPNKTYAGIWEFQGGCAISGDDSLTAAVREAKEEVGLDVNPENAKHILTVKLEKAFLDVWLFVQDFDINSVVLQPGETVDAKVASMDYIRALLQKGEFFPDDFLEELFAEAGKYVKNMD